MKDMNETFYIIGFKIYTERSQSILNLSQKTYINKFVKRLTQKTIY